MQKFGKSLECLASVSELHSGQGRVAELLTISKVVATSTQEVLNLFLVVAM